MDWRDPTSVDEKRRLIEKDYGDTVPGYLLFHLGTITRLTDEEELKLNDLFFDGKQPGFGDKEMHGSHGHTGSYLQHAQGQEELAPFVVLRIRDARRMHYAITMRGEERPLLQVSNGDGSKPILNFMERWGLSPQDVRATSAPRAYQVTSDPSGVQRAFFHVESESHEVDEVDSPPEPPRCEPFEALKAADMPPPRTRFDRFLDWLLC